MDIYEMSPSDYSGVDELLDFSNHHDDVLSANDIIHQHHNLTSSSIANGYHYYGANTNDHNNKDAPPTNYHQHSTDFTDHLSVPSDDVAELEWLSNFVHDSFSDFPANNLTGTINYRPENTSFHSRSRTKRTRAPTTPSPTPTPIICNTTTMKLEPYSPSPPATSSSESNETVRRCTHCASEKTPQWRTGPLGPKTLCNACGVRYKSGRLVPEYRPAASPTFVLTQHSNSHRKVMELRRQKEMMLRPQQPSPTAEYQIYGGGHHHHHHNRNNYEIC
ncbi:putative transcription factor C2C2-GATA family [Helianthus annuus]|nr:putative transcription factor C2C2-GATA family [Helianthus annuus]